MLGEVKAYRLMPWAWFVAWLLTGVGASIIYVSQVPLPSWRIILYIGLSIVGWALAGFSTASASRGTSGMAVQLVAWAIAYLVAIPLGLVWMKSWDMAPFLLFMPVGLAGAIGGIASSARPGLWRLVSGALVGLVFLLYSTISFYAGYILILGYSSMTQRYGVDIGLSYPLILALPEALCGFVAGFAARWILDMRVAGPANASN